MTKTTIKLGYEVGTAEEVNIPLHHMVVTGITQLSGKTTTLEALISRSGLKAIAFRTKRGESGFKKAREIPPFFRERSDWVFVEALLEAAMKERLKFERGNIIRVCHGAETLNDVWYNVRQMKETARGINLEILERLDAYMKLVIPEIEKITFSHTLDLKSGVNMIDLIGLSEEIQCLVIASVIQEVHDKHSGVIVIVPEANEFIPQQRGSPVKLPAMRLARKGAAIGNYLWMDTQDIAGVEKDHLKQMGVWILGIQTEQNEVERTLKHIPNLPKPTATQLRGLNVGHFYACFGGNVKHTYVQPTWLSDADAKKVARGEASTEMSPKDFGRQFEAAGRTESSRELEEAREEIQQLKADLESAEAEIGRERGLRIDAQRRLDTVKKFLEPDFKALQAVFAEIGSGPAAGAVDRSAYEIWWPRAAQSGCKRVLEILIDKGRILQKQLCTLSGCSWETFKKYRGWLTKNNLARLDGEFIELVPLS